MISLRCRRDSSLADELRAFIEAFFIPTCTVDTRRLHEGKLMIVQHTKTLYILMEAPGNRARPSEGNITLDTGGRGHLASAPIGDVSE